MINISIDDSLRQACPAIQLACIYSEVTVHAQNQALWQLIDQTCDELAAQMKTEEIRHLPAIAAARQAYKACGKDPARYRLSAEALLRRVLSGKGLYRINNVVDLLNLVSIRTGFSIGGYDADRISGAIRMGIGQAGEPYEGLGRGVLNIEGMPVFRDDIGAFGSSTSDSERTGVTEQTKHFLMVLVSYDTNVKLQEASEMAQAFLADFAEGKAIENTLISL